MQNITLVGNLTADPILRTSGSGDPRATFSIAINTGDKEKGTEKTYFVDCTAFGQIGENVVASLKKGNRAIVVARLNQYKQDVQINGEEKSITRTSYTVSAIGPDLLWATADVNRGERKAADAPAPAARAAEVKETVSAGAAASSDDF